MQMETIKKMIVNKESDIKVKKRAVEEGMRTLRKSAIEKLEKGETSLEEVLTVTFNE